MIARAMGEILTISVASAIPLELLVKAEKPPKYDFIFLNVRTLFRNFYGSIEEPDTADAIKIRDEFFTELQFIESIVTDQIPGAIQPLFYLCSNKSMPKLFRHAQLRVATTVKQQNYEYLERQVMEYLYTGTEFGRRIKLFDTLIKGNNSKSLILTHFPLELLSSTTFRQLDLIESHTGVIKDSSQWNTKLTNHEAYRNIPFNILTIQLIGDNSHQFHSMGPKYIKPFLDLAVKAKWSAATTIAKVKFDIDNKIRDRLLANTLLEMIGVKLK